MPPKIGRERSLRMIEDIVHARHDLVALAKAHQVTPEQLAAWIGQGQTHHTLQSLCVLADIQTQLMLSRFRLVAAGRLIKLATDESDADIGRRACVDLLRLELHRPKPAAEEEPINAEALAAARGACYEEEK